MYNLKINNCTHDYYKLKFLKIISIQSKSINKNLFSLVIVSLRYLWWSAQTPPWYLL